MDRKSVEQYRLGLFGRMVMGVSHELDNHLSVVLGFAELIQVTGAGEKKALEGAGKILSAGEKIAAIVKQFAHYVRPHSPEDELFSPSAVLSDIVVFSRYDLGRGNVAFALPEKGVDCHLRGDGRDFALAILAILINGVEAMSGRGGTLALGSFLREETLHLSVIDEGPGVPPEVMPRIFEDGFTTRSGTVHSGMGLPVARHIVSGFGGSLMVKNRETGGCLVSVRIPVSARSAANAVR